MKNNKRIASSSSPLSGSWIIIAALVLHVQDVKTWTTLPTSISSSRRHLPPRNNVEQIFLRSIENPLGKAVVSKLTGRTNVGTSSLPMIADEDADSQQEEKNDDNEESTGEDNQTDEDTIMEIANALTSSKPSSMETSDELEVEKNVVENYLDKAAVAWEGAAISAKTDSFDKAKINKTRLVGLAARESFLSSGFKAMKGSIPKSNTRPIGVGSSFKAPAVKGAPITSTLAESRPNKSDISTTLKGSLPKQFAPLDKKSYGNTFLSSSLKAQKGAVGLGEVKQFTGSFVKSMTTPGFGDKQKTISDLTSSSGSGSGSAKIRVGIPSGPKFPLKGSISITKQSSDNVSNDSRPKISSNEQASNESSIVGKESDGKQFLSSLKIPKGTVGSGDKRQAVGSFLKSIKSPGIKSIDVVNKISDSESNEGRDSQYGLKTPLKPVAQDLGKESPTETESFVKPDDNEKPTQETDLSDGNSKGSTSQSSYGNEDTSITAVVNSSGGEYSRKIAIDFNEESKASEEKEKWIFEQNELVEERRRKRLAETNLDLDGSKATIAFGEESKAIEEKEKWISEQNQLVEERRLKRLQDPKLGAVGAEVALDFDEEIKTPEEKEKWIAEQNRVIEERRAKRLEVESRDNSVERVTQVDSNDIPLKGNGTISLSSLKVPKSADATGEKNQVTGVFLKSTKAPGFVGTQKAVDSHVGSFSKKGILSFNLNTPAEDESNSFSDSSVYVKNSETYNVSNSGEGKLFSAPFFVTDLSKNDFVSVDGREDANDGEENSSDYIGESSASVRVGNAVASDAIDFKEEANSLEEQEQWIKEQNQLVEKRRLKRLQESGTDSKEEVVEQNTNPPNPNLDEDVPLADNVLNAESTQIAIDSYYESNKFKESDLNRDDAMSPVKNLSKANSSPPMILQYVANAESSVKSASPAFSSGLQASKSFGDDPSKLKLGVASSGAFKGFPAKKVGLPYSPTSKGALKRHDTGNATPIVLKGAVSKDSGPQQDLFASPTPILPPDLPPKKAVRGTNPDFPTKSFGVDPLASTLGVASSIPMKGIATKTTGLPFPPTVKGAGKTLGAGIALPVLQDAAPGNSDPEEDVSTSSSKVVGIAPPVVLKGAATAGFSVKGASPAFSSGVKGTMKSFGIDASKSKLGVASSIPMKGIAAKTTGLPFPPTVKGVGKTLGAGIAPPVLQVAAPGNSDPEEVGSTSSSKVVGIAPPVVLKGVATAGSSVKDASPAFSSGVKGTMKSFGIDPSKSKLGVASSIPMKGIAAKTTGFPFPSTVKGVGKTLGAGIAPPVLQDAISGNSDQEEDGAFVNEVTDFNVPHTKVSKSINDLVAMTSIASAFQDDTSEDIKAHLIDAPDDRVRKEIGTGAPYEPKAFSPPRTMSDRRNPGIIDVVSESTSDDEDCLFEFDNTAMGSANKETKMRPPIQPSRPLNLWSGESFKGTVSSRSYGLGFNRPLASPDSKSSDVEPTQTSRYKQERDEAGNTTEMNTDHNEVTSLISLKREDKNMTTGDPTHTTLEMNLKLKLLEEKNRLLEEKLRLKILETTRIEENKRKAEQRVYSEQIGMLSNHISRLEKQVSSAAAKAERAVRSREDEIKKMTEVIERKTNSQSVLESRTEMLLREIDDLRSSTDKQNRNAMENLKNSLLESVKMKLSELKSMHEQKLDSIASQLKVQEEKRKEMSELNQSQSKELSDLKTQLIHLKESEPLSKTKQNERENKSAVNDTSEQPQSSVEEVMKNIQNIAPLHNIILASDDVSDKQGSTKSNSDTPANSLPKYETLSQGARIPTAPKPRRSSIDDKSSHAMGEVLSAGVEISEAHHNIPDALAADVEALELISFCHADFDSESPSVVHPDYDPIRTPQECAIPSNYPFVSILRDSSPYIVNHRHSTIVYHIPGELISDSQKFFSVMDDIALTWLFGMKIVIAVGCRRQIVQRLEKLHGASDAIKMPGVRVTTPETLRILEEEAGFCRFEVERLLNHCLRNKGADCNVVSGCFITANKFGVVDGIDYQLTGYPVNLQVDKIHRLHSRNDVILLTPLGFTKDGDALNVHSEALAAFTAGELKASKVVYFSSHPMVLRGARKRNSGEERIQMIQRSNANEILSHYGLHVNSVTGFPSWKSHYDIKGNVINRARHLSYHQQAMLLKMGWATHAIEKGVERAHIIDCEDGSLLGELFTARRGYGTCISQDDYEAPHPEDWNDDLTVADGVDISMIEW